MRNIFFELDFFYMITPFLISPKGEKFPRFQLLTYYNPDLTPSPLGEGWEEGQNWGKKLSNIARKLS
jgi:hypothetical protein